MNAVEEVVEQRLEVITLQNKPDSVFFWRGLGGNFDNLIQILCEFIDNSFSNFKKHNDGEIKNIAIRIMEIENEKYEITVEDTGTGIYDLDVAFSIGATSAQDSSLNEHGFGMKHALAAANPQNDNWLILTRTEETASQEFYYSIQSSYHYEGQIVKKEYDAWPGMQQTGTIIKFTIDKHLLRTITKGLRGGIQNLALIVEVLAEDLGYIYANFIKEGVASLTIRYKAITDANQSTVTVGAVEPKYNDVIAPGIGTTTIDLGEGDVELQYEFLEAVESDYKRHYRANMSTSGVEIRVNGRLLEDNLFTEIWGQEKHNAFNYILIKINVKSDDTNKLPSTTTSKNGLRQDDEKLAKIYDWIRSKLPEPKRKSAYCDHETELFKILEEKKEMHLRRYDNALVIEQERGAFTTLNEKIRIDLYLSFQGRTTIYEGKKGKTSPQDVYQLMMYWDGLVMDEVPVHEGILIGKSHPDSVKTLIESKNQMKDAKGNLYNFHLKTWEAEDVL